MSSHKLTTKIGVALVVLSVSVCAIVAFNRSRALVAVTVTAIDPAQEPSDHDIPFLKRDEALPDYALYLLDDNGNARFLGVKPNESAENGLSWTLDEPRSISLISTVRLTEKDKLISDELAEVHITSDTVETDQYRFEFQVNRSFAAGVDGFFRTPIGMTIAIAIGIAVLCVILPAFL